MKKRLLCLCLTAVLILGLFAGIPSSAQAAEKTEKTRAIAIVFDNSGSMYELRKVAWCQAIYAMEVFAAMMNEQDKLLIYPMHEIQLGKQGSKISSLTINGPDDAYKIRDIYTPSAGGTPFASVTKAYEGLMKESADEKYLIILTDGSFTDVSTMNDVEEKLEIYSRDVLVKFMGIGENVKKPAILNPSRQEHIIIPTGQVLPALSSMCNQIFGRDELQVKNNSKITFDVTMGKIIIFVQGEGITNVTLNGGTKVSEHTTMYSTLGAGGNYSGQCEPDKDLQGMLVTYANLDADPNGTTYEISFSGNSEDVVVYFEPDVDLSIQLVNSDGIPADFSTGKIPAGNYRLEYNLIDSHGKPTNSKLLGDPVYDMTLYINEVPYEIPANANGSYPLTLEPETSLKANFNVRFLEDYSIKKDNAALGWPLSGLQVGYLEVGNVELNVTGGQTSYDLSTMEQYAVYDLTVSHDGELLTGEDLLKTAISVDLQGGNAKYIATRTDTGYTLYILYNGDAASTDCGEYTMNLTASYTLDTTGQSGVVTRNFTVVDDSTDLGMYIEVPQYFYQISKIPEGQPLYVYLTRAGVPMDAEQFAAASLDVQIPGAEFDIQPDAANSRFIITLKKDNAESGKHPVTATVTAPDEVGRPVTVQATAEIELKNYPAWLPGLLTILGLLLIALLIWLYLNTKILPKHITVSQCTFIVDGDIVAGAAKCVYTGKNKRRGTLSVTSPHYGANPAAKCGYTLELEAVSPRRTKSKARSARVVGIRPLSAATTIAIQIGGCNMAKDPATEKLTKVGGRPGAPINFNVGNNARTSVTAEVMDMANGGGEITVSLSAPLKFL